MRAAAPRTRLLQVLTCLCAFATVAAIGAPVASAAGAPSIDATSVTDIQGISALLSGKVNPNGLPTTYRFEYGTSACPGGCTSTPEEELARAAGIAPPLRRSRASRPTPPTTTAFLLPTPPQKPPPAPNRPSPPLTASASSAAPRASRPPRRARRYPRRPSRLAPLRTHHLGQPQPGRGIGRSAQGSLPRRDLKNLRLELPPGLVGNPSTVNQCTLAEFGTPRSSPFEASLSGESCPDASQVGVVAVHSSFGGGSTRSFGLFNLVPPPGVAAELGFAPFGDPVTFDGHVRTAEGEYGLTLRSQELPTGPLDRWRPGEDLGQRGTPWALSHDSERGNCLNEEDAAAGWAKCTVGPPKKFPRHSFLTLPTSCEAPPAFKAAADSWQRPGTFVSDSWLSRGESGQPQALEGCERLGSQLDPLRPADHGSGLFGDRL